MKRSIFALALLAAVPFAASAADGINYNYVEGGYVATKTSGADADGWALKGSAAIAPNFNVFGDAGRQDITNSNASYNTGRLGVGYHTPVGQNVDFVSGVAYERVAAKGYSSNGYSMEGGVAAQVSPRMTLSAKAGYEDAKHTKGEFYGKLGAQVGLTPNWAISGEAKLANGANQYFIGPRYSF